MTTFADSETRLRRMLRDPSGDIWTSTDLQTYFNDAQIEVAQKTNLLLRTEAHYYPPRYDYTYLHDWEYEYVYGDYIQVFQVNQINSAVITHPWEAWGTLTNQDTPDDGDRVTQSWEIHYCTQADPPAILLHAKFDKMKFLAYDQEQIQPIDEKYLRDNDRWYRTRQGEVTHYWRPDDYSNLIYLYPTPSTAVIQAPDVTDTFSDPESYYPPAHSATYVKATTEYVGVYGTYYAYYATDPDKTLTGASDENSWSSEDGGATEQRFHIDLGDPKIINEIYYENYHALGLVTDMGVKDFTFWGSNVAAAFAELTYATDTNWTQITGLSATSFDIHTSVDEADPKYIGISGNSTPYRYYAFKFANNWGHASYMCMRRITLQSVSQVSTSAEIWLDETDYGLVTDQVDTADALFAVYQAQPNDIVETTDESDFPDYLVKYIEYATLERAYSADTDGFIPSLRDYWKFRKEVGLKALERFKRMSLGDRDYRLGGQPKPTSSKRLRLPEHYPAI